MMKAKIIPISVILLMLLTINSCEDSTYKEYMGYKPVYMTYDNLRKSVEVTATEDLVNPGKIYFKDDYIFIVEEMKGIHVYDNSNPSTPLNVAYIKVPGVMDISISGFHLYADSFVDLVVINIEDPESAFEESRVKDVLPYVVPPHDTDYPNGWVDSEKGVVLEWNLTTIKEKVYTGPVIYPYYTLFDGISPLNSFREGVSVSGSGVGVGGSMARFGIRENVLYTVDNNSLKIFDISIPGQPVKYSDMWAGWGIETMFITDKTMFLGTTTGMFVYDLTVKFSPSQLSFFVHGRSCDPVIVDGNLAYITLRSGTTCGGSINSLDVVDVSSLSDPELLISYPMFNPHGLGKDGDLLFICDGSHGLKIYDAADPLTISDHLLYSYADIQAFDVIPLGTVLILIGDDGLVQYDYSDISDITVLSTISTTK